MFFAPTPEGMISIGEALHTLSQHRMNLCCMQALSNKEFIEAYGPPAPNKRMRGLIDQEIVDLTRTIDHLQAWHDFHQYGKVGALLEICL